MCRLLLEFVDSRVWLTIIEECVRPKQMRVAVKQWVSFVLRITESSQDRLHGMPKTKTLTLIPSPLQWKNQLESFGHFHFFFFPCGSLTD